jgi:hypothetical protein
VPNFVTSSKKTVGSPVGFNGLPLVGMLVGISGSFFLIGPVFSGKKEARSWVESKEEAGNVSHRDKYFS